MIHSVQLLLFFGVVFGVIALPGLDMAFVIGSSLALGRRHGFASVAGIVVGGACLVTMTVLGIGVLLTTLPATFNVLMLAGALYLAWIGVALLRSGSALAVNAECNSSSAWVTFRRGVLTTLMNPKAYLFMLAVLPQFLRTDHGTIWQQAALLWLIIAATQTSVYGTIAISMTQARGWLVVRPSAMTFAARAVGAMLIIAALIAVFEGWRTP